MRHIPPDPAIKQWATAKQAEYIDTVLDLGSVKLAAKRHGVTVGNIYNAIAAAERSASQAGYSPRHHMIHTAPAPFVVKGVSTLYDGAGEVKSQWVKTTLDGEQREAFIKAAIEAANEDIARLDPLEGPEHTEAALCNLYTLTDAHVGMKAWHKEGGADWDLTIAERTIIGCFERLISQSPRSRLAIFNQQGDFGHTDGLVPITPTSGHVLDADSRFSKMVGVMIRIHRRIIDLALMRHEAVHVVIAEGNHDPSSAVWLRHLFAALYENEPRVTVDQSEIPYYVYQHGKTMLGVHHGHLRKNDQLPLLFAAQYPVIWGATTKRYVHTGHRHHAEEREHSGMKVIQHPTLAARDAYAARGGWISERQVQSITYHSEHGEVGRVVVTPEMVA